MRIAVGGVLCLLAALGGCADPNKSAAPLEFGGSKSLVMGPALRMVTERPREIPGTGVFQTMCAEPSPDVAIAFGQQVALQGSYSAPSAPTVSGSVNASTSETATALLGRTAGVVALRDGLYA